MYRHTQQSAAGGTRALPATTSRDYARVALPPNPHRYFDAGVEEISDGAHEQTRTADRLLTMQVLYRLSYVGPRLPDAGITPARTDAGTTPVRKKPVIASDDDSVPEKSWMERETGLEPATLSLEG
jgi:hypothetical protein